MCSLSCSKFISPSWSKPLISPLYSRVKQAGVTCLWSDSISVPWKWICSKQNYVNFHQAENVSVTYPGLEFWVKKWLEEGVNEIEYPGLVHHMEGLEPHWEISLLRKRPLLYLFYFSRSKPVFTCNKSTVFFAYEGVRLATCLSEVPFMSKIATPPIIWVVGSVTPSSAHCTVALYRSSMVPFLLLHAPAIHRVYLICIFYNVFAMLTLCFTFD